MRPKWRTFVVVVGVLLVVSAIGLAMSTRPLYGQAAEDNWVPDLRGTWNGEVVEYLFDSVTDPDPHQQPVYLQGFSEGDFVITDQTGRVFAGTWEHGQKMTGVILPDRTVSIQAFELPEHRIFGAGRLTVSGGRLQLSAYVHLFSDFGASGSLDSNMASAYVRLVKVDSH